MTILGCVFTILGCNLTILGCIFTILGCKNIFQKIATTRMK